MLLTTADFRSQVATLQVMPPPISCPSTNIAPLADTWQHFTGVSATVMCRQVSIPVHPKNIILVSLFFLIALVCALCPKSDKGITDGTNVSSNL